MKNLRKYGKSPFSIAVLHGGPGTPGEMALVARGRFYDILKKELR